MSQEFKIKNGLIVSGDATISGAATVNGNSVIHTGNVGSYTVTSLTDTLATVTGRGATTTSAVTVGSLSSTGNINLNGGTLSFNTNYFTINNGGTLARNGGSIALVTDGTTGLSMAPNAGGNKIQIHTQLLLPQSSSNLALANASATDLGLKFYASSLMIFIAGGQDTVKIGTNYFATNAPLTFGSQSAPPYINYNGNHLLINAGTLTTTGYISVQTGNLLVGTTTDSGYKLDVNGTARVLGTHRVWRDNQVGDIDLNLYNGQAGWQGGMYYHTESGGANQRLTLYSGGVIGTADALTITSSRNVGIGTTTPATKLQVAPASAYTSLSGDGLSIWNPAISSANIVLGFNGSATNSIQSRDGSSGTYGLSLNPFGGNVGIGTTNPQSILEVRSAGVGNAGAVITLNRVGNWAASYCGLKLNTNDAGTDWWNVGMLATGTNTFNIGQNGSAMMSILVNGNIGIGTTAPDEKLQVAGNIKIQNETGLITDYGPLVGRYNTSQVYVGTGGNYSIVKIGRADGGALNVLSGGNVGIGTSSPSAKLHVAGNAWINRPSNKVDNAGCTELGPRVEFNNNFSAGQSGYVIFRYPTYNNFLISGDYDGNIGGAIPNIQFGKQSTVYLHMNSSDGNVGIGTTAPDVKLHVSKDYHNYIKIESSVINQQTGLILSNSGVGKSSYVWEDGTRGNYAALKSSTDLLFEAGGGAHYSIFNTSGNFGIGTTTPSYKLHVSGTGYVSSTLTIGSTTNIAAAAWLQFNGSNVLLGEGTHTYLQANGGGSIIFRNNSASTLMTLNNGGNLGINTLNPLEKLHVSGAAIFDGGSGNSSTDSVVYITKSNNNDWGLYVNASGLDYGMYTRVSPSANYAFAIHNGTTWTTRITGNAIVYLGEKNAIEGNSDSWLRLNNSNHYTSGVYTPGVMRADGGFQVSGSTVWHAGNDGSGSGLDADTVDGVQADNIVYGNARGTNQSITNNNNDLDKTGYYTADAFTTRPSGVANWMYIEHIKLYNDNTAYQKQLGYDTYDDRMWVRTKSGGAWSSWKQIWTSDSLTNLSQLTNGPGYITSSSLSGYATTSYVTTQINNLINGAPGALDTLSELASALGNDASFATTVTNSIAGKMALYNGAGAPDFNTNTTNGVYRNQGGANGPAGGTHVTMFSAFQPDSNYGWQLASSSSDNLYFRFKDTSFNSWVQIATRSWVTSLGYATTSSLSNYLPLAGGTMTGNINMASGTNITFTGGAHSINGDSSGYLHLHGFSAVYFDNGLIIRGGITNDGGDVVINDNLVVNGTITESSSLKLKENVETSEGNLEKVVNLRPVTYNKIGSQTTELGLIAEEVAEVYPEFVQYDENGEPVGVHYSRLTAALIGAVKELTNQVQELNKKING